MSDFGKRLRLYIWERFTGCTRSRRMNTGSIRVVWLVILGCALAGGTARGQDTRPAQGLKISDNHRFLTDAEGKPFFYLADTAWEIFHRLTREEATEYLKDRAQKRFNVI